MKRLSKESRSWARTWDTFVQHLRKKRAILYTHTPSPTISAKYSTPRLAFITIYPAARARPWDPQCFLYIVCWICWCFPLSLYSFLISDGPLSPNRHFQFQVCLFLSFSMSLSLFAFGYHYHKRWERVQRANKRLQIAVQRTLSPSRVKSPLHHDVHSS